MVLKNLDCLIEKNCIFTLDARKIGHSVPGTQQGWLSKQLSEPESLQAPRSGLNFLLLGNMQ
jgi:hypothetical protein